MQYKSKVATLVGVLATVWACATRNIPPLLVSEYDMYNYRAGVVNVNGSKKTEPDYRFFITANVANYSNGDSAIWDGNARNMAFIHGLIYPNGGGGYDNNGIIIDPVSEEIWYDASGDGIPDWVVPANIDNLERLREIFGVEEDMIEYLKRINDIETVLRIIEGGYKFDAEKVREAFPKLEEIIGGRSRQ